MNKHFGRDVQSASEFPSSQRETQSWKLIILSAPAVPMAMLFVPLIAYMPTFYATEIGLGLSTVGIVFMIVRAIDGMIDPLVGMLSDVTKPSYGRRRIWMIAATPLLVLSALRLCKPPAGIGPLYLGIWITLFYVAWSSIQVPYLAWTSEISDNYRQRTRVFAFTQMGTFMGILAGVGLPAILLPSSASLRSILGMISNSAVAILSVAVLLCYVVLREPNVNSADRNDGFLAIMQMIRLNRPFQRLFSFVTLFYTAINIHNAVIVLFVSRYLQLGSYFLLVVLSIYVGAVLWLPICVRAANRWGRHRAFAVVNVIGSVVLFLAPMLPKGELAPALILFAAFGMNGAVTWAILPALTGDVADYGIVKWKSGASGIYMAGYNLAMKLGTGLGVGIGLPMLELLGYKNGADLAQTPVSPLPIVACYFPALLTICLAPIMWSFPITPGFHRKICRIRAKQLARVVEAAG